MLACLRLTTGASGIRRAATAAVAKNALETCRLVAPTQQPLAAVSQLA